MIYRALLIVLACSFVPSSSVQAESESFKVGVMLCLTGECAEWGSNSLKGLQLAHSEINKTGGVLSRELELVIEDTNEGGGGAAAVSAFNKLSQEGIVYFIGPSWSTGGLSLAPLAKAKEGIIVSSPSLGVPDFNRAAEHLFNTWPHDEIGSKALAKLAIDRHWHRAAIFSSQQPWESTQGDTFEAAFIHHGGAIVSKQEPLPTVPDLRTEALRIVKAAPDVVFLSNFNQMGTATRQLRQAGYNGPLLAILMDDTRIKAAAGALDGAIFARYPDPSEKFQKLFKEKYGHEPGITADTAYDTLKVFIQAISRAQTTDPSIVKTYLQKIDFSGASGRIVFDEYGAVKKTPVFYVVQGSETKPLEEG